LIGGTRHDSFFNVAVAILIPAEKRAYSWYQHMRAHGDPTAINMSFKQVPLMQKKILYLFKNLIIYNFMICAKKNVWTKKIFPLFWDPGWIKIRIRDKHPGSAALIVTLQKYFFK
jgi:hypothetical protein